MKRESDAKRSCGSKNAAAALAAVAALTAAARCANHPAADVPIVLSTRGVTTDHADVSIPTATNRLPVALAFVSGRCQFSTMRLFDQRCMDGPQTNTLMRGYAPYDVSTTRWGSAHLPTRDNNVCHFAAAFLTRPWQAIFFIRARMAGVEEITNPSMLLNAVTATDMQVLFSG